MKSSGYTFSRHGHKVKVAVSKGSDLNEKVLEWTEVDTRSH